MEAFSAHAFYSTLALVGIVILGAALLSGVVERSGLPQVAVFLGLGAVLGPAGLGLLDLTLDSPALRVVATLSLVLVLFTDAVALDLSEVRRHGPLALLVLGPGTLLTAALITVAGWGLLGLSLAGAAILGAALASTDPVLLRGLLRRRDLPSAARQALQLESGLNDGVLLPVVLVAMAFLASTATSPTDWARLGIDLVLLGPGAGVIVGLLAVAALDLIRRRIGVQRDYESLYALGVAFTAAAVAEMVHGSGFLAAFAAGLTIVALDTELCDCFQEYGRTTAEMALLFTFVLFGGSLIWSGFTVLSWTSLLFAVFAVLVRPVVFLVVLARANLDRRARLLIAWFGPRGLSSLLLVLLPVFAGLEGSEELFALCCLVVLLSIVVHGGTPMVLAWATQRPVRVPSAAGEGVAPLMAAPVAPRPTAEPAVNGSLLAVAVQGHDATPISFADPLRVELAEVRHLWQTGAPVLVLDVRTERSYHQSDLQAQGAVRLDPDHAVAYAQELGLPGDAWLLAYCT